MDYEIETAEQKLQAADAEVRHQYERYVMGEGSADEIKAARPAKEEAMAELDVATENKKCFEGHYHVFCSLLKASTKETPLCDIVDCIKQITVGYKRKIEIKWMMRKFPE